MHLLLCTTGPQQGLVHTGHMDQSALASKEAVRGWCQVTQHPDPAITLPKFVQAHNRLPETCVLHTNLSFPQDILMYLRVECHCPAKLPTAEQCCGSQARQQHMTVRTPWRKNQESAAPNGVVGGRKQCSMSRLPRNEIT